MWTISKVNITAISLLQKGFYEDSISTAKRAIHILRDCDCYEGEQDHAVEQEQEQEQEQEANNHKNTNNNQENLNASAASRHESRDRGRETSSVNTRNPSMVVVSLFGHASQHRHCRPHPEEPPNTMTMIEQEEDNRTNYVVLAPDSMTYQDTAGWPLSSFNIIYCRAFAFNEDFCSCHKTHTVAIVLFNLGLTYHLYARLLASRSVCETKKKMQSALQLYKLSWTTLQQHSVLRSSLLTMALLTNMSHIFSHFLLDKEAWECLDGLGKCLADPFCVNGLEEEDLRFFSFHATYSQPRTDNVAPAA